MSGKLLDWGLGSTSASESLQEQEQLPLQNKPKDTSPILSTAPSSTGANSKVAQNTTPNGQKPKTESEKKLEEKIANAWYSDGIYLVDETGIYTFSEKNQLKLLNIYPIEPIETLDAKDSNGSEESFVKLKFKKITGQMREMSVPVSGMLEYDELKKIYKIPSGKSEKANLDKAITHILNEKQIKGKITNSKGYKHCGWVDGEHVKPGHALYVGVHAPIHSIAGDYDTWKKAVVTLGCHHPIYALAYAYSLSGYTRGLIDTSDYNPFFYVYGKPGLGKTGFIEVCCSFEGQPIKGTTYYDSLSSNVGVEGTIQAHNHSPYFLDELDKMFAKDKNSFERLLYIANQGGRAKGSKSGTIHKGASFKTVIVSTGNSELETLSKGTPTEEAFFSRILSLNIEDFDLYEHVFGAEWTDYYDNFKKIMMANRKIIQANYGFAYPAVIEMLKDPQEQAVIKELYLTVIQETMNDYANSINYQRSVEFMALLNVGSYILGRCIDEDLKMYADRAIEFIKERLDKQHEANAITPEFIYQEFKMFLSSNAGKFIWDGHAYSLDSQKSGQDYADDLSRNAQRLGNTFGAIRQDSEMKNMTDFNGTVYLSKIGEEALSKACKFTMSDLVNACKNLGVLRTSEDGNTKKLSQKEKDMLRNTVSSSRCHVIKLVDTSIIKKQQDEKKKAIANASNIAEPPIFKGLEELPDPFEGVNQTGGIYLAPQG